MASFYGIVVMVIGMSLLLAAAGVQTSSSFVISKFTDVTTQSPTSSFNVDAKDFNNKGKIFLISLLALITVIATAAGVRSALGGTFGVAESLKTVTLNVIMWLIIADLVALVSWASSSGAAYFGGLIKYVAWFVYIPLAVGTIISGLDWIGGGR